MSKLSDPERWHLHQAAKAHQIFETHRAKGDVLFAQRWQRVYRDKLEDADAARQRPWLGARVRKDKA